jgi:hypothetical protein
MFAPAAVAAVAAALAIAPAALSDQPTTTVTTLDRTGAIPAGVFCPFAFTFHTVGTLRTTTYSDGRVVTHAVSFHVTYTNPANGKSVTTTLAGPVIVVPNGDGTVTVTVNGNDGHITAPGQGSIFADVGKLVYIAAADDPNLTPITILRSTGQQDPSQFPATCAGLA